MLHRNNRLKLVYINDWDVEEFAIIRFIKDDFCTQLELKYDDCDNCYVEYKKERFYISDFK